MSRLDQTLDHLLSPLNLRGGRSLPMRVLPGPMEGIMTPDFCKVMMEFDLVKAWITPFIRVLEHPPRRHILAKRIAQFQPLPMIVQIMGTHTESLADAAETFMTIDNVQGIELNCACPSRRVLQSGAGAALLASPEWIRDTLLACREAMPSGGLGVKVRSGLSSPDELPSIVNVISKASPDWVTIHYRTASEGYRVIPDGWQRFKVARDILDDTPLFASGDLFTPDDVRALTDVVTIDGITPARGLLKNPWLLNDIEAFIAGKDTPEKIVSQFLIRMIELGKKRPNWRPGNILDIARMAWGEESVTFRGLTTNHDPDSMVDVLKKR